MALAHAADLLPNVPATSVPHRRLQSDVSKFRESSSSDRGPTASRSAKKAAGPGLQSQDASPPPPPPPTAATDGRDAAIRHLARLAARYPDLNPETVRTDGLDTREAALAHAIVDQAVRRWITIEHLIRVCAMREPAEFEPRLRAALLSGGVQLLFLDRIPDHAAIDQTVEWAKTRIRPGAAGITNAVLRRLSSVRASDASSTRIIDDRWEDRRDELPLSSGGSLRLAGDALPSDSIERWAVSTGLPRDLLSKWDRDWGSERARDLALHAMMQPPTILNVSHAESRLPADLIEPHSIAGFAVFQGDRGTLSRMLNARRDVWVQDSSAGEAVNAIAAIDAARIVDVCAGRGTKTRQLRATFPGASIIASDTDRARLAQLEEIVESDERVAVVDSASLARSCNGKADLALLDVPCSNTGVLARRAEARHRYSPEQSQRLREVQIGIVKQSLNLVRSGGWVVYSTCSIEPEENEELAKLVSDRFGLRLEAMHRTMPAGKPGEPPHGYRDGSFWAVLQRP